MNVGKRIYLAAPIHKDEDAEKNANLILELRVKDYDVWSPQEAGIASDVAKRTGRSLDEVRKEFMKKDLAAMKTCDICVAYLGREREPSQGMLWEMGWMSANNKLVILFNPCHNKFTLMAQFTVDFEVDTLEELLRVLRDV